MKNIIPVHLIENGTAVKLDEGIYTYREPFVNILQFADEYFSICFAEIFDAHEHYYPVITPVKLVQTGHGGEKFGDRLLFVSHLKESLDTISDFTNLVAENGGWSRDINISDKLKESEYVFNPLCSYHIFETVKSTTIPESGLTITSQTKCFLDYPPDSSYAELRDFTIREFVTFGKADQVNKTLLSYKKLIEKLLADWGLNFKSITNGNQTLYSVYIKELDQDLRVCECAISDTPMCEAFKINCEKSGEAVIYLEMLVISLLQNGSDINSLSDNFKSAYKTWKLT